ncbi:MAG: FCD domain-containing protein, partial [Hyphomicrobiales bacterium]
EAVIDALSRLSLQIQMCRVIANQSPDLAARAANERDEILDALRRRDADRASELMDAHIADVQQAVMAHLKQQTPANDLTQAGGPARRRRP